MINMELSYLLPQSVHLLKSRPSLVMSWEPDYPPSEYFEGNPDHCSGFLLRCRLTFSRSPSLFPNHLTKIIILVTSLKGYALRWAHAFLQTHSLQTLTHQHFFTVQVSFWSSPPTRGGREASSLSDRERGQKQTSLLNSGSLRRKRVGAIFH